MSVFAMLNIGRTGMAASGYAATNASQNAANAATEGYARRVTRLEPIGPEPLGGVRAIGSRRVQDRFLERQVLVAASQDGYADGRVEGVRVLDDVFSDGAGSLELALSDFYTATSNLAASPKDTATRTVFLERGKNLSETFRRIGERLLDARNDANERIADGVTEVNERLVAIGDLSAEIGRLEATGNESSDLRDRRDLLIKQIAEFVPVTVLHLPDGRADVLLAGSRTLVDRDGRVQFLETELDPVTGNVGVRRAVGYDDDVTHLLTTGSLGGLITSRDGAVANARRALDELAFDLAAAYDAVHAAGFGLDGGSGRPLFAPMVGVDRAALNLRLSADVDGQPEAIAAAEDPASLPGDNRAALALEGLARAAVTGGGTVTAVEAIANMVGRAGSDVRAAEFEEGRAEDVLRQVEALRQSVSGVVTDEEMINLTKFQRAFQASARVVQIADEMLAELVNLKR